MVQLGNYTRGSDKCLIEKWRWGQLASRMSWNRDPVSEAFDVKEFGTSSNTDVDSVSCYSSDSERSRILRSGTIVLAFVQCHKTAQLPVPNLTP
jgi:hypothetical protein